MEFNDRSGCSGSGRVCISGVEYVILVVLENVLSGIIPIT